MTPERRPPPAIASSSSAPPSRPVLADTQQPIPEHLLRANAFRAAQRAATFPAPPTPQPPRAAPGALPPPPPRPFQLPPPPARPAPQAPRAYQPPTGPATVGTAEGHAATTARLRVIWSEAERLDAQMATYDPTSIRMRLASHAATLLMAEADALEAQLRSSQQIHPPG